MTGALIYESLSAFYGPSRILHDLTMRVGAGTVTCLLGLNGMGKTTTLRATMGLVDRMQGRITLNGADLSGRTCRRSRMGVTLVPEDRKVFPNLTVAENLVATRKLLKGGFILADAIRLLLEALAEARKKADRVG